MLVRVNSDSDFSLSNLPYGVFSKPGLAPRVGTRLGDTVVDLAVMSQAGFFDDCTTADIRRCFSQGSLNDFMALGPAVWAAVRAELIGVLSGDSYRHMLDEDLKLLDRALHPQADVKMHLPCVIGDFTDFYASEAHATNVGTMFRGPDSALQPNWRHLPVAYHGRASSVVVSGTALHRPCGQTLGPDGVPALTPSRVVDYELEMGALIGSGTELGRRLSPDDALREGAVFGLVLLNDWSARDVQKWEYVPLGPFGSKNWGTTISPWVVTWEALQPFRCAAPQQDPPVLPYLREADRHALDVRLEASVLPEGATRRTVLSVSNLRHLYWTLPQMVAHHTVTGCSLRPGDLLGTGTISCDGDKGMGSLLELSWNGRDAIALEEGGERTFLQDGDSVRLTGVCVAADGTRVGFGECDGTLLPHHALD